MTLRSRKILFYILVFVFLSTGSSIIFYSQGWRINFNEFKIQKTGAIFIKSYPENALLFLDDEPIRNQSGLLQNGTLMGGLLPKTYAVRVDKEKYHSWAKNITVYPELVTKYEDVVLVPQKSPVLIDEKAPSLRNRKTSLAHDPNKNIYFLLDKNSGNKLNLSLLFNNLKERELKLPGYIEIKSLLLHPTDEKIAVISTENALYVMDINSSTLNKVSEGKAINSAINNRAVVWSEADNSIGAYYFSSKEKNLAEVALSGYNKKIQLSPSGNMIGLLQNDGGFYLFSANDGSLSKISSNTQNFEFSDDDQRVAIQKAQNNFLIQDFSKNKESHFYPEISENISHIFWFRDSEHLILASRTGIYFSEVDDKLPHNTFLIAEGQDSASLPLSTQPELNIRTTTNELDASKSIFYNRDTNILYFLKDSALYAFDFR